MKKGYTLVEVLVVIALIAILTVIVFVATSPTRDKGRMAENVYQASTDVSGLGLCDAFGDESEKCTKSASTCTDLGWSAGVGATTSGFGVYAACGESDAAPLGACSGLLDWEDAYDFCADAGARLCTVEEVENSLTVGTGCYDAEEIWTLSPCNSEGIYKITGNPVNGNKVCEDDVNATAAVRCCADN